MSRIETYSISVDFTNGISPGNLRYDIETNGSITTPIRSLVVDGDNCNIEFAYPLQASEKTELDSVVAAHTEDPAYGGLPVSGGGVMYRKANQNAVFWRPDGGSEVNLTVPNAGTTSASASDTVTSSSTSFFFVNGMEVTAPNDGQFQISLHTSVETTTKSVQVEIVFYKNGVQISGPIAYCGGTQGIFPTSLSSVQTLATNDVVTVYARRSTGNGNYKIYYRQLSLIRME